MATSNPYSDAAEKMLDQQVDTVLRIANSKLENQSISDRGALIAGLVQALATNYQTVLLSSKKPPAK